MEQRQRKKRVRGNGEGTVFKRGNTWTAQITFWVTDEDGNKKRKFKTKGGFKLKRDALSYIDELKNGSTTESATIAFNVLYDLWSKQHYPRISKATENGYKSAYDKCQSIHHRQFATLKAADLQKIVDNAKSADGATVGRRSRADIKSLLSNMYRYASENDIVEKDYSQFIVLPKKTKTKKDTFTTAEIDALWNDYNSGGEFTGYILIMIYTGMRYGEIAKIRKENIYLSGRYMVGGIKTEAGIDRTIPICDKIFPIVEALYNKCQKKMLVIHEKVFYNEFYATLERLNIRKLSPHCCRHTTATALANANVPPAVIVAILGHKDYTTTLENYTHIKLDQMLSAVNKL
jgi:integrase